MNDLAARERCASEPARDLWKSVPLDLALSVVAIILAATLKLFGVMP